MATAYNLYQNLGRAGEAQRQTLVDPGDAGTIKVSPSNLAVCVVSGGTTRTLEAAADVPTGTIVTVISQTSTITVNSVALGDGEFAVFITYIDSSGDPQWSQIASTDGLANAVTRVTAAAAGGLVAVSGGADKTLAAATPAALGTVTINTGDGDTDDAIVLLADALEAFGLVTHTWSASTA